MSKRREDDSRPSASAISQRATVREVPAAKYKDASVGTVAPRGLRGPSLLPGQGAPERIVPEEVELAVLRDAETLDGPKVARAVASKRANSEVRASSPTRVSVEVPRARSISPPQGDYASTPPTPSARSIQSGTLMSIGSVDPRAPTELSLPSPHPLSVSDRPGYLPPPAVVDRSGQGSVRSQSGSVLKTPWGDATQRSAPPSGVPAARSVAPPAPSVAPPAPSVAPSAPSGPPRAVSVAPSAPSVFPRAPSLAPATPSGFPRARSVAPPAPSAPPASASFSPTAPSVASGAPSVPPVAVRRPLQADSASASDSLPPPAQNLSRSPVSQSTTSSSARPAPIKPPRPAPTPLRPPRPTPKPPRSEPPPPSLPTPVISSPLSESPRFQIHSELDAVPHEVLDDAFDLRSVTTQREPLAGRKVPSASEWIVQEPTPAPSPSDNDRSPRMNRSSSPAVTLLVDRSRDSVAPVSERVHRPRAAVPLSWVLGAAAFAVILALIVAFALRPSAPPQAVSPLDGRASAVAPTPTEAAPRDSLPPSAAPGVKRAGGAGSARANSSAPKPTARSATSAAPSASVAPQSSADPNSKAHQSIY